ncbi:MAG: hypothetical protein ACXAC8_07400 [Candidatus Hodarchaeales archaeon]|jgi:hypothetical protein
MIGIEITSKVHGLPLFTHEFRPNTLFNSEIRGGLISAIMQVMGETFGPQETKIVNYGNFNAILVEGTYVYGVLFSFQTGPIFEKFITELIETFENKFQSELGILTSNTLPVNLSQFDFSNECSEAYNSLLHIDVRKLGKILDQIQNFGDKIFDNMLIFSRPEMSQIYTDLTSERFGGFSNEISIALKNILDLSNRTTFPIDSIQIALSNDFYCIMFNIFPFAIVIFVNKDDLNIAQEKIKEFINAIVID